MLVTLNLKGLYPNVAGAVVPVHKLYFQNFPTGGFVFKVNFQVRSMYDTMYGASACDDAEAKKLDKGYHDISKWIRNTYRTDQIPFPGDLKERQSFQTRTLFLKHPDRFDELLDKFGHLVISAERPINQTHYNMLLDGDHVVFRENLFWRKYRYRVGFRSSPTFYDSSVPWLMEFFEDRSRNDYKFNANLQRAITDQTTHKHFHAIGTKYTPFGNFRRKKRYYYYGHNIFVNNKEDIVMIKLRMNEDVFKVERIFRYEELGDIVTEIADGNQSGGHRTNQAVRRM